MGNNNQMKKDKIQNFSFEVNGVGPIENLITINENNKATSKEKNIIKFGNKKKKICIFANNGSGKSKISEFFNISNIDKNYPYEIINNKSKFGEIKLKNILVDNGTNNKKLNYEINIKMEKEKKPLVNINKTGKYNILHVFNSKFINENVFIDDYANFTGAFIGGDATELNKTKRELEKCEKTYSDYKQNLQNNIDIEKKSHTNLKISTDYYKKIDSEFILASNFDKDKYDNFLNAQKKFENQKANKDKKFENLKEIDLIKIDSIIKNNIDLSHLFKKIEVENIKDDFSKKINENSNFYKDFYDNYIKNEKNSNLKCPICNNEIPLDIIEAFIKYYTSQENNLKNKLDEIKMTFNSLKNNIDNKYTLKLQNKNNLLEINKVYNLIYPAIENADNLYDIAKLNQFINIVEDKSNNLTKDITSLPSYIKFFNDYEFSTLNDFMNEFEEKIEYYNLTIADYNNKVKEINKKIKNAKKLIEKQRDKFIDCLIHKIIYDNETLISNISQEKKDIDTKKLKIYKLSTAISKKTKINEIFRKNLEIFFNDKYEVDNNFKVINISNDKKYYLSDGEKNIFALCYYFACVYDKINNEDDLEKVLFIIDDPVNSLDNNYLFHAINFLKKYYYEFEKYDVEKDNMKNIKSYPKMILFTHSYKFASTLWANNIIDALLVMHNNEIKINDFKNVFESHLYDIVDVIKNKNIKHTTGNTLRFVLERFKSFYNPKMNFQNFVDKNFDSQNILYVSSNITSHLFDYDITDQELIDCCIDVYDYMLEKNISLDVLKEIDEDLLEKFKIAKKKKDDQKKYKDYKPRKKTNKDNKLKSSVKTAPLGKDIINQKSNNAQKELTEDSKNSKFKNYIEEEKSKESNGCLESLEKETATDIT